jgi:hypothetical protein
MLLPRNYDVINGGYNEQIRKRVSNIENKWNDCCGIIAANQPLGQGQRPLFFIMSEAEGLGGAWGTSGQPPTRL